MSLSEEPTESFYPKSIDAGDIFVFRVDAIIPCHFLPLGQAGAWSSKEPYENCKKGSPILFLGTDEPDGFCNATYDELYNASWTPDAETAKIEAIEGIQNIQEYSTRAKKNNKWLITKGLQDELQESINDPDWSPIDTAAVRYNKVIMGYWLLEEKLIRYDFSITILKKVENYERE